MPLGLRDGISYCETGDRLVFLDIDADRYFALDRAVEAAFRQLVAAPAPLPHDPVLARLHDAGFLIEREGACLSPASCVPRAVSSLLDCALPSPGWRQISEALLGLMVTRRRLQCDGLGTTLARLKRRSRKAAAGDPDLALPVLAAAYDTSARLVRSHDQCLVRSIALTRSMAAQAIPGELVIGVRLRPFAAHCWVQCGDVVVNDRIDQIASFTPIVRL